MIDPKAAPTEVIEHSIADGTNSQKSFINGETP